MAVREGGQWAISQLVTGPTGAWSTAAMTQQPRLATLIENYLDPASSDARAVGRWVLVRMEGDIQTPGPGTILLPAVSLDTAVGNGNRSALRTMLEGRFPSFTWERGPGDQVAVVEFDTSAISPSSTMRDVVQAVLTHLQHD